MQKVLQCSHSERSLTGCSNFRWCISQLFHKHLDPFSSQTSKAYSIVRTGRRENPASCLLNSLCQGGEISCPVPGCKINLHTFPITHPFPGASSTGTKHTALLLGRSQLGEHMVGNFIHQRNNPKLEPMTVRRQTGILNSFPLSTEVLLLNSVDTKEFYILNSDSKKAHFYGYFEKDILSNAVQYQYTNYTICSSLCWSQASWENTHLLLVMPLEECFFTSPLKAFTNKDFNHDSLHCQEATQEPKQLQFGHTLSPTIPSNSLPWGSADPQHVGEVFSTIRALSS